MTANGDVAEALTFAGRLADAARPIALAHFRTAAAAANKDSAGFDPVTEADTGIEAELRALIAAHRPEDGILGEEGEPKASRSGLTWVLDPIDGTRAFIAGLPSWTVLIALQDENGPQLSIIDQPFTGERFSGVAGEAAWLDQGGARHTLRVDARAETVETAIVSTTDPGLFTAAEAAAFDEIARRAKVRRYGLDAYAYAMLALGGLNLVVESGLKPWDAAALIPVVTGAGGIITDWSGRPCHGGGQVVAAATPALHAAALARLAGAAAP